MCTQRMWCLRTNAMWDLSQIYSLQCTYEQSSERYYITCKVRVSYILQIEEVFFIVYFIFHISMTVLLHQFVDKYPKVCQSWWNESFTYIFFVHFKHLLVFDFNCFISSNKLLLYSTLFLSLYNLHLIFFFLFLSYLPFMFFPSFNFFNGVLFSSNRRVFIFSAFFTPPT